MASSPKKKLPFQKRARSVPFKRPFLVAAVITSIMYLMLLSTITAGVCYAILQTTKPAFVMIGFAGATLFFWFISLFKRREARCPLCKGTPYLNTGAHLHEKATKLPLLNHGNTNVISTIFGQRLRCMYCGTPYDFLKPVTDPIQR